ncbi:MAG: STAS domain-containing protein [Rhodospirillaceae bacterium]|jgi:anti-sigma B factor antagonist|nr:STAS domain-containing protein [Rhodospirillaceae bacterium]MBT5299543.1 STAS domain-containing protein [Rhodospirillaceae bacterium]MBT5513897.1 STAS domain-containing protein [Rhodospirillaceae bacterium]MBT6085918.1 STAS domain-containing protein [Rhodospirillaceae bacterium]MBT6609098.1 STAS domain-containing protein [Rhodospirillaceae bacterium]
MVEINISEIAGQCVVGLTGDVDLSCSSLVRDALMEKIGQTAITVVDLAGVEMIDSSGVASLVEGHQQAKKRGSRLVLVACRPTVLKVLQLAKLDDVFEISGSLEDALGSGA